MKKIYLKKTHYIQVAQGTRKTNVADVPSGSWIKCQSCGEVIYKKSLKEADFVCGSCQKHFRMDSVTRLSTVLDEDSFEEFFTHLKTVNILEFKGYDKKIATLKEKTKLHEGIVTGTGTIDATKLPLVLWILVS